MTSAPFSAPIVFPNGSRTLHSRYANRLADGLDCLVQLLRRRFPRPLPASPVLFLSETGRLFVVGYEQPVGIRVEHELVPFEVDQRAGEYVRFDAVFDADPDQVHGKRVVKALRRLRDGETVNVGHDFPQWLFDGEPSK